MYPKVFAEFCVHSRKCGPVSALPTDVFFYGMKPGEEITVDLERGKTVVIRLLTIGDTHDDGQVQVFFELNGQPRSVRAPNRSAKQAKARRKADETLAGQVAAPFQGAVSLVAVRKGQALQAGDVLLSIEAMKMETDLHAPHAGVVKEIHVAPGDMVDAKDLVVEIG